MRKAILAALAVLCSVGATETTTENQILANKEPGQEMIAQCGGGSKVRASRGRKRADDGEKQAIARCGKRSRKCSDCGNHLLAGKCKDGNCKRPGSSRSVA
jgi:hypothetical protein